MARGTLRRLWRLDGGFTVIEVSVAAALTVLSLTIVSSFLVSAQKTVGVEQVRSTGNDESRLGMEQLDREIRSSNFILPLDPYTLLVESQNNAPSPNNCVLWVLEDQQLRRQSWPLPDVDAATGWRVIADHVVNRELGEPLFTLPDTPANRLDTGGFTVDVTLYVNPDLEGSPSATVVIRQSLTGRNVTGDFVAAGLPWPPTVPKDACQVLPS